MESNPESNTRIKGFITYLQLVLKSIDRNNYNPELVDRVNKLIVDFYDEIKKDKLSLIGNNKTLQKNNNIILDEDEIEDLKSIKLQIKERVDNIKNINSSQEVSLSVDIIENDSDEDSFSSLSVNDLDNFDNSKIGQCLLEEDKEDDDSAEQFDEEEEDDSVEQFEEDEDEDEDEEDEDEDEEEEEDEDEDEDEEDDDEEDEDEDEDDEEEEDDDEEEEGNDDEEEDNQNSSETSSISLNLVKKEKKDVTIDLEIYDNLEPEITLYEKIIKPVDILSDYRKEVKNNWLHKKLNI